jgi:sec-independent protein translocase protein TatA
MFGNIGPMELIVILVIALLVFGPKKLPEIGRSIGKAVREFKKTSEEIRGRIEDEIAASEVKDIARDLQTEIKSAGEDIQKTLDVPEIIDVKDHGEGPKVS